MPKGKKNYDEVDRAADLQKIEKLRQLIWLKKREKCRLDLYWLATEVLFKQDIIDHRTKTGMELYNERYHRRMAAEFQYSSNRILILKARNTFKTYLMVARLIQRLLNDPNERILLCNVKLQTARAMLAQIKHLFTTEPLKSLFPEYLPKTLDGWGTQDQFTVPCRTKFYREPSVLAISTGSRITGPHFSGFCIDDPIDAENCTTEDQLNNTKEWWERLQYLLDPGGWIVVVGTIYHYQDLYADPIQSRGEYRVFRQPILAKTDKGADISVFPERWPLDRLLKMRDSEDPVEQWNFWHQMMLEAKNIGDVKFDPEWLITIDKDRVPPNLGRIITIDSAWKGEETRGHGDYTAIQVFGYDNLGHIYRQDCVYSNTLDILDGVSRICDLMAKWRISTVVIERVGQDTFGRIFTEECRRRGLGLRLIQPKRDLKQSKKDRIMALQPYFKLGQFMLVSNCPYNKEFTTQYTCFPNVVHDDLLDGAADVLLDEVKVMPQAHYRDDTWQSPIKPMPSEGNDRSAAYERARETFRSHPVGVIRPNWTN